MPRYVPGSKRKRGIKKLAARGESSVEVGRLTYQRAAWTAAPPWQSGRCVTWITLCPGLPGELDAIDRHSERWGFTRIEVVSLFAYRARSPEHLFARVVDIAGPRNRDYIRAAILRAGRVVVAWGDHGGRGGPRLEAAVGGVLSALSSAPQRCRPVCLGPGPLSPADPSVEELARPIAWGGISSPTPLFSHLPTEEI